MLKKLKAKKPVRERNESKFERAYLNLFPANLQSVI